MIFKKRRQNILRQMKDDSIMILFSATAKTRSNDTHFVYRQDSNFYYLSGLYEDNSALVLIKKKNKRVSLFFVQQKDKLLELWTGKRLGIKKIKQTFDVDDVYPISQLNKKLQKMLGTTKAVYFDIFDDKIFLHVRDIINTIQKGEVKYTPKEFLDAKTLIYKMRLIKTNNEIELIKKAISISKDAHHKVMKMKKRGLFEYELQAKFEYEFKKLGTFNDAYTTIVASGNNANTLHYIKNSKKLKNNDLILIDAGCEYKMYASDITRTLPVSGKFTKSQKELYKMVLNVQEQIINMIKPNVKRSELQRKARKLLCEGMIKFSILKGNVKKLIKENKDKTYYPHGIGHYMGLDVHDTCPYKDEDGKEIPLLEGMVLTIEPGIYLNKNDKNIPKKYRGIGIRIEDDILVTKNGYENLSSAIVKTVNEIEAISTL